MNESDLSKLSKIDEPDIRREEELVKLIDSAEPKVSNVLYLKNVKYSGKNWNQFYQNNTTNGYKDRHYILNEFYQLKDAENPVLLDIGCGVGNAFFPIMLKIEDLQIIGIDFSKSAINLIKKNPLYNEDKIELHQCDITKGLPETVREPNYSLLLFVLSSIIKENHIGVVRNIYNKLLNDGFIYFRDYAYTDLAQIRFSLKNKVNNQLYMRSDGTFAYFFKIEEIKEMFESVGFKCIFIDTIRRRILNRKEGLEMNRVWLHAVFQKK